MVYSLSQFKSILNGLGYPLGPASISSNDDTLLDCDTQAAIQAFQSHHDLPPHGELDRATQEKARQLIRNLQHSLNLTTDANLPVNEFFGPRTSQAIQVFQQQHGLPITGIAGPIVRRKLDEEVKRQLRHSINPSIELQPSAQIRPFNYRFLR